MSEEEKNIFDNAIPPPIESSSDMASLTSLMEDVMYLLPGVSDVMVRKTLSSVYRDFCRRTATLVKLDRSTKVTVDDPIMMLSSNMGTVETVMKAMVDGKEVKATVIRNECGCVGVRFDSHLYETEVQKEEKHEYSVLYSIMPVVGCEMAPTWFLNRFGSGIVNGTLYRLHAMSGKPWSDPSQANMEVVQYTHELNNAVADRLTNVTQQDLFGKARHPWVML